MLELIETKNFEGLVYFILVRASIILVCWLFMVLSTIVDFWSGVTTARAVGQPVMSRGFRRTIIKISDYMRVMLFALMFDMLGSLLSFYILPFATALCTMAVMIIEGKSVIENSRRKKTHAADMPDIIKRIVRAATAEQGKEVLDYLYRLIELENKKGDYENK
jgi:hypothetical protein